MNNFAKELADTLKSYTKDVKEGIEKEVDNVAKETAKELKSSSPKRTGKYAKGWGNKKAKSGSGYERVVYNRTSSQLTHLLEKGHANRDGGRTKGIPHIEIAEQKGMDDLEKNIEKVIKNGG